MDCIRIEPTMLSGKVQIPPSKSVSHRALIAAALTGKACKIENVMMSKDVSATLQCIKELGFDFVMDQAAGVVSFSGKKRCTPKTLKLNCEESGSTLRFMIPLVLLSGKKAKLVGKGRLMSRPQKPYMDIFKEKGIFCRIEKDTMMLEGELKAGTFSLPGNVSSQFVTGLLFALPLLKGDSEIVITTEMESKGYLDLTLSVLKDFGIEIINDNYKRFIVPGGQTYQASDYLIEGDYSQAAFFLVAGALGCDLKCYGLKTESLQGDKAILKLLKKAGAEVFLCQDGALQAKRTNQMNGIVIDAREIPDLVPILAVLCGFLRGESQIINAGRLRMKESDRLSAIAGELSKLGLSIGEGEDYLKIQGVQTLHGETVSAWNDHRIVMALAIAACRCEGAVTIDGGKDAVQKSYPDFFEVYKNLQKGPQTLHQFGEEITEKG